MSTNKRSKKNSISYTNLSPEEVKGRLGVNPAILFEKSVSVQSVLSTLPIVAEIGPEAILQLKKQVFEDLRECAGVYRYPTEALDDFNESTANEFISRIITPVVHTFNRRTNSKVFMVREKFIQSIDDETHGKEDFVALYEVTVEKYLLVVEAKKSNTGLAFKQCLLALKDMYDTNGDKNKVFGFMATGADWTMAMYDGANFQISDPIRALYPTMLYDGGEWNKDSSMVVDLLLGVLSYGKAMQDKAISDGKKKDANKNMEIR